MSPINTVINEAVSLILIAGGKQIFLIKRRKDLPIYPGFTAFPGGKLAPQEESSKVKGLDTYIEEGLKPALKREISEELGWTIPAQVLQKARYFGSSTTPEFWPLRFCNHYLVCQIEQSMDFALEAQELCDGRWMSFDEFHQKDAQGQLLMVPPTRRAISALPVFLASSDTPIPSLDSRCDVSLEVPCLEFVKNVWMLLPLSKTFPPANRTNAFVLQKDEGEGHLLIDPSPQDNDEFVKLKNTLKRFQIKKILITHHHPDHHQYAPELARELRIPVYLSKTTQNFLQKKYGATYLADVVVHFLKEGDWLAGHRIYEVPGHDEGQLALAPPTLSWFLAGDLIQTVGTVVIGGAEGDMAKYMASLQRVLDLEPLIVFPSHGLPMGGTEQIKLTLKHRMEREEQILELSSAGKTNEEMLEIVYKGLKPELKKYALKTIEAHLIKLKNESKLRTRP
ncbi:MAG: MBL fold metallo-hydrolase [Bdellovibrio sp.]|nr:MBL fold metallo-hydrolase [Bdellovibrio sp.]